MARRLAPAGQRRAIIRWAFLRYHAGRITSAELTRCLEQFRR